MSGKTAQLSPVWGSWHVSSGAGGKRTWWINRTNLSPRQYSVNGLVYDYQAFEAYETRTGALRRYASYASALATVVKLNA